DDKSARNWEVENDRFVAEGQGGVSMSPDLPEKFTIRFNLTWKNHPNFRFTFADPLKTSTERVDRYFLQFGGAGLEIKRESKGEPRYTPIVLLSRTPDQY